MQAPKTAGKCPMADSESGYQVGPGRPPLHTRFNKGRSGNPGGRRTKSLPALLADALNETVVVTIDGRRRTITKHEAIVTQMVDKSASADLRATKMLIDMMKDVEQRTGEPARPLLISFDPTHNRNPPSQGRQLGTPTESPITGDSGKITSSALRPRHDQN